MTDPLITDEQMAQTFSEFGDLVGHAIPMFCAALQQGRDL